MLVQAVDIAVPEIDRILNDFGLGDGGGGLDSVAGADAGEVSGRVASDGFERARGAREVEGFVVPFLVGFEGGRDRGGGGGH